MMLRPATPLVLAIALLLPASPALAQRFTFERTLPAGAGATLDVTTTRGKIDISRNEGDQIVIRGTVTVRVGLDVPANAVALAQQLAAQPVIEQHGTTVRLQPPTDTETRRAVTVSYEIRVPRTATVTAVSDSGAINVTGIGGTLSVRTKSAAVTLQRLGGNAAIVTSSGAVKLAGATAHVSVQTQSGGIELRDLGAGLTARSQSGRLSAVLTGPGDVDVETGSSAIGLTGVTGALRSKTTSGGTTISGSATGAWTLSSTSGAIRLDLASADFTVDATTGSGSVVAEGVRVSGTNEKRHVAGTVGAGGPLVHLTSRSGSIRLARLAR